MSSIVRKARLQDIPAMLGVINAYAAKGIMLPRTEFEMAENIRDFVVAELPATEFSPAALTGCGALHFYTPQSAEVRSLAVDPLRKAEGLGRRIVEALEAEAIEHGLSNMFAFTYVPGFFTKLGFVQVDRGELPLKAWKDCLRCPKFQACDEIAMLKRYRPDGQRQISPLLSEISPASNAGRQNELVRFPTPSSHPQT
jgi:amino-acid N-acetyltransferase